MCFNPFVTSGTHRPTCAVRTKINPDRNVATSRAQIIGGETIINCETQLMQRRQFRRDKSSALLQIDLYQFCAIKRKGQGVIIIRIKTKMSRRAITIARCKMHRWLVFLETYWELHSTWSFSRNCVPPVHEADTNRYEAEQRVKWNGNQCVNTLSTGLEIRRKC